MEFETTQTEIQVWVYHFAVILCNGEHLKFLSFDLFMSEVSIKIEPNS